MGIWSIDGFASDEALDWLQGLDPAAGAEPVLRALRAAAESPDPRLDAARSQVTLAAAELIAALHGRPHPALPESARRWLAAQRTPPPGDPEELPALTLATRALDLVVTSSALAEIWSQQDDQSRWQGALDDLRMRLAAAGGVPPAEPNA
jgi:Domain of unknown function (DUF4259)